MEAVGTEVWCHPVSFSEHENLCLLPCLSQLSVSGLTVLPVLTFVFLFSLLHIDIDIEQSFHLIFMLVIALGTCRKNVSSATVEWDLS